MTAKHTAPTMREALEGLVEAVVRDSNESKSISGYTGARLSDARAALSQAEPDDTQDMAAVGRSLMVAIEAIQHAGSPYEKWAPAENPAEIVTDLFNDLIEALVSAYDSGGLTVAPGDPEVIARIISRAMLDNPVDGEFSEREKRRMELAQSYADEVLSLLARHPAKPEAAE